MPDVFTKAKRSEVMSRIRSRGNRDTELALAAVFRRAGITGWRRQREIRSAKSEARSFRVKPDFVFLKLRLAVFVDGCFWHVCPLHATKPRNHAAFWRKKLAANQARDRKVNRTLRAAGWRVLRIWEHELKQGRKRKAESGNKTRKASTTPPGPTPEPERRRPRRLGACARRKPARTPALRLRFRGQEFHLSHH